MGFVRELDGATVRRCRGILLQENKKSVKARVSEEAKLYAEIRFSLEQDKVRRPQAWLDTLAREAEVELQEGGGGKAGAAMGLLLGRGR